MMKGVAIGIDFGTTNTEMAIVDEFGRAKPILNAEGEEITPTVVAFEDKETPIVGREASRLAIVLPQDTLVDFKLKLGCKEVLYTTASGRAYMADDLAAEVLRKIRRDAEEALGEKVTSVVITCPANFQADQREDLLQAAKKAGLNVTMLLGEPTAAAMAYGLNKSRAAATIAVVDLGGGTFDLSIARISDKETLALGTSGIPVLGGRNFTQAIVKYALDEFEKQAGFRPDEKEDLTVLADLRERSEHAKATLAVKDKTVIPLGAKGQYVAIELTRATFEQLTQDLIRQITQTCEDLLKLVALTWMDIDKVLLVGGASRMPAVKAAVEQASGKSVNLDIDPLRAVSYGAALQAAAKAGGFVLDGRAIPAPKLELQEVLGYSIGCMVDEPNRGFSQAVIVPRHSAIPSVHEAVFRLKHPEQTRADIRVMEGNEGDPAERCLILSEAILDDLPVDESLPPRLQFRAEVDVNAIIKVTAKDLISGKLVNMEIDYSRGLKKAG